MRSVLKILSLYLTVVLLNPHVRASQNGTFSRFPAEAASERFWIQFENGKLAAEITSEGIVVIYDKEQKPIFSGEVQQVFFPLELNPRLLNIFKKFGIKYNPDLKVQDGNNSAPSKKLAFISGNSVFSLTNSAPPLNPGRNTERLPIPLGVDVLKMSDWEIGRLFLNYYQNQKVLSVEYINKKNWQLVAATYDYGKRESGVLSSEYTKATQVSEGYTESYRHTSDKKMEKANEAINSYLTYVDSFSKTLENLVLGQPEGVSTLVDIEKQNILANGDRKNPEVAMFVGLPGSGKDTLAEAYIQMRFAIGHRKYNVDTDDHLFRYPVVKEEKDAWTLTGSGTGYLGSSQLSRLNRFLVQHSGGKYLINSETDAHGKQVEYVTQNPEWSPGKVLPGYYAPEDGALFINEFHDWSLQLKNSLLKEALEKGYFAIGNPGKGISRLQVPITIFLASNDGVGLITARDRDGRRVGEPLNEEQLMERWEQYSSNKVAIKEEIANPSRGNPTGGTSEELLSRIPNSRLVLLRPLAKNIILKIAAMKLEKLKEKFLLPKAKGFPSLKLKFSPKLIDFLATYDQLTEEGARTLDDKIKTLIEKPLSDAIFSKELSLEKGSAINLDIQENGDGTFSLAVNEKPILIGYTEKGRDIQPITDAEIDRLNELETGLNKKVKGLSQIVHQLAKDVRRASNSEKAPHVDLETKTADVYMFLGTSSTGKTELATALHQVLYSTSSKPLVIDFSQIQTIEDLKAKILGVRDLSNKSIPSDFMQEYDRRNGKMVVVLDEISNANPEILKALYDLLREPVVQTFSDKKSRPMGQVKIVMTGNAGEEWYKGIPRDLPESEQLEAARRIYDSALSNEGYRRKFLMSKFSEAFINRVGDHRIFFFGPHTPKTVRELIQLKLVKSIKDFSMPSPSKRTWDIKFKSAQDYQKTVEAIEDYGFKLWEQGASITNFIQQVLMSEIHDQLLTNKIPDKSEVTLVKTNDKSGRNGTDVGFQLFVAGRTEPLSFQIKGKAVSRKLRQDPSEILLTAFHEAGHEVVNHVLLGDKIKSAGVSILPGVTEINGQWVSYEGIARHEQFESYQITKEMVIAQIAVLAGGEAAEQLSTRNARHTAGKANDIQRATNLAKTAILKWGLSEKWGRSALLENQNIDVFLAGLSAAKKTVFEREVQVLIEEGRALAKKVIIANYENLFNPIAVHLASRGEISGPVLQRFYKQREHLTIAPDDNQRVSASVQKFQKRILQEGASKNSRDVEFYSFIDRPKSIVNIEELRAANRNHELSSVDLSEGNSVTAKADKVSAISPQQKTDKISTSTPKTTVFRCEALFR